MPDSEYDNWSIEQLQAKLCSMPSGSYGNAEQKAILAAIHQKSKDKDDETKSLISDLQNIQADIKKLTKPHWSLSPTFWLVLVSTLAVLFQVWQSVSPNFKPSNPSVSPSSTKDKLKSSETDTSKTSQSKPVPVMKIN